LSGLSAFARAAGARPFVYGHRGAPREAPENTLRGFARALARGADGIELDVRLCGSGEVVVLHDRDLLRVAGVPVTAREASLAELQSHDLGGGERVPRLDEALDRILGAGALLNVELKARGEDLDVLVPAVLDCVRRRAAAEQARVIFSSFSPEVCARLLVHAPRAAVAWLFERIRVEPAAGLAGVHPDHELVDAEALAVWKARGLVVNTWTINEAPRARELAALGVDGLITDDVAAVMRGLV
jgi:glycerophosphoryl diester phosphodiesterase